MALALSDLLQESHVDLDLRTRTLTTALQKLVKFLEADEEIRNPERFLEQVLAREKASPTYVENEVAFPHARTELVDRIVLAIGRSRSGIPFGPNGEKASLIFLIGVPKQMISDYLVCVGTLARLLKDAEVRQRLLFAETPAQFLAALDPTDIHPFG